MNYFDSQNTSKMPPRDLPFWYQNRRTRTCTCTCPCACPCASIWVLKREAPGMHCGLRDLPRGGILSSGTPLRPPQESPGSPQTAQEMVRIDFWSDLLSREPRHPPGTLPKDPRNPQDRDVYMTPRRACYPFRGAPYLPLCGLNNLLES